ncbi:MAG: 4-hydroxy-3-methylbut-2-enyl diphosphate reductase [Alphaproteobacteria bacterium]
MEVAPVGTGTGSPLTKRPLEVKLAKPRGFCAGVERAIEIVERALALYGAPVYVRHEIVHNKRVVQSLHDKGAIFVEEVDEIPPGAVTVFSAHGVSRVVEGNARDRTLQVIDATCPLVSKVHKEGRRSAEMGHDVVLIGHKGHPEVEGTMGQIGGKVHLVTHIDDVATLEPADPERLTYVTQTTLSVDDTRDTIEALQARFPAIQGPDVRDICYATQNRQTAVRDLCADVDVLLVVGAHNSSNSNRLREIGEAEGIAAYLIEDATALDLDWLAGARSVGITAGASAPEELVQEVVTRLATHFETDVTQLGGVEENVQFKLPTELTTVSPDAAVARA